MLNFYLINYNPHIQEYSASIAITLCCHFSTITRMHTFLARLFRFSLRFDGRISLSTKGFTISRIYITQPLWIENPKVVKRTESPKSSRQAVILSEAKNLAL